MPFKIVSSTGVVSWLVDESQWRTEKGSVETGKSNCGFLLGTNFDPVFYSSS